MVHFLGLTSWVAVKAVVLNRLAVARWTLGRVVQQYLTKTSLVFCFSMTSVLFICTTECVFIFFSAFILYHVFSESTIHSIEQKNQEGFFFLTCLTFYCRHCKYSCVCIEQEYFVLQFCFNHFPFQLLFVFSRSTQL